MGFCGNSVRNDVGVSCYKIAPANDKSGAT